MAARALRAKSALINPLTFTPTPGMAPAAPLMRMLARFDRAKVEAFVEISISLLDLMDGDPDTELNGDEYDHSNAEDCFIAHSWSIYAGCPISDPGGCEHDGREPNGSIK